MSKIETLPRVVKNHPELSYEDVDEAMRAMVRYSQRATGEWVAVGFDSKGRFIELVYLYSEEKDAFLVYHAMTPPSAKTLKELRMER